MNGIASLINVINTTPIQSSSFGQGLGAGVLTRDDTYREGFEAGEDSMRPYAIGVGQTIAPPHNGIITPPTISNISPGGNLTPGQPGAFSATFSEAKITPLTFQLSGLPSGCTVGITIKFENQDQKLVVLDFAAGWCWPFDINDPDNNNIGSLLTDPVAVQLLPRGGWPPGVFFFEVAALAKATDA